MSARQKPRNGQADQTAKYRSFLNDELQAAARYELLARVEKDPGRSAAFRQMAAIEMKHAAHWATLLGIDPAALKPRRFSAANLVIGGIARSLGTARLLPYLLRGEIGGALAYARTPAARDIAADERHHQATLRRMAGITDEENTHVEGGFLRGEGGTLRAAVLGINDGLVSNFSLVMGVAGGTEYPSFIILAGVAGLVAGSFSMGAGEYISMRSQRDVYEGMIEGERAEIELWPEEEELELSAIYQRKGLTKDEADLVAKRLMRDPEVALETKIREELGLDPGDLGSPWGAAFSSMTAFAAGAIIPILPFLFGSEGLSAVGISAALSGMALMAVGGGLAWFSGVSPWWGAARMLGVGAAAAAVTYGVGRIIGVSVS